MSTKITFYRVYKSTIPYITSKSLPEDVAKKLGFAFREKKNYEDQWYRTAPKNPSQDLILKRMLRKHGILAIIIPSPSTEKIEKLGWEVFSGYEWGLFENTFAQRISDKLIRIKKRHKHLSGMNIGHFFKNTPAPFDEETKQMTFAYATVANRMNEKFAKLDFIIYYYEDAWKELSKIQKRMLCDHELGHCGMDGTPYVKDHDLNEFKFIIKNYGLNPPDYHWASDAVSRILQNRDKD